MANLMNLIIAYFISVSSTRKTISLIIYNCQAMVYQFLKLIDSKSRWCNLLAKFICGGEIVLAKIGKYLSHDIVKDIT